jgi:hypothetical protein
MHADATGPTELAGDVTRAPCLTIKRLANDL